ncbi:hypothetical protein AVEN_147279-1 [Araneus ventricosus]|uniref:Uncharacterized protein n=1 Tax=Araneus ventricosus TaxID=182803 RepID=A0A4Y2L8B8_ARAVE|nr:hypothetical protein AVEN_147279-1 [Araneus ventricosus]
MFEINHKTFFQSIYLDHNAVTDFTGEGLSGSILNTTEKFGLVLKYIGEHLTGLAVNGQCVKLGVAKHLKKKLSKDIIVSCNPMLKIELIRKHAEVPKIVADAFQLIHDTMKHFSIVKSYEMLLENFDDYFYKPKLFKTMKVASYCEDVFKTFICDYLLKVFSCEQDPDGYVFRHLLMNKETMLNNLALSDICCCLGKTSRKVQDSDLFPWQYMSFIQSMISSSKIMIQYLEELSICLINDTITNCAALLKRFPGHLFYNLKKSVEMFNISQDLTSIFLGVPLPEKPVSSKTLRLHSSVNNSIVEK